MRDIKKTQFHRFEDTLREMNVFLKNKFHVKKKPLSPKKKTSEARFIEYTPTQVMTQSHDSVWMNANLEKLIEDNHTP